MANADSSRETYDMLDLSRFSVAAWIASMMSFNAVGSSALNWAPDAGSEVPVSKITLYRCSKIRGHTSHNLQKHFYIEFIQISDEYIDKVVYKHT